MSKRTLRIATRSSALALWQAEFIKAELERLHDNVDVELIKIKTQGDKILDVPLAKIGGKGLFVKELEEAMLDGRADLAVHSMKDVPMEFPEGLGLVAICEREDPTDAFVSNQYEHIDQLPEGAVVGTASLRREAEARRVLAQIAHGALAIHALRVAVRIEALPPELVLMHRVAIGLARHGLAVAAAGTRA